MSLDIKFDEIMKRCCICCEDYVCSDKVVKYSCHCKYIYHTNCLLEWLGHQGSGCPICRKAYSGEYLLRAIYKTDIEQPDFEPFYFHPPITIDYLSIESDDDDLISLGVEDNTGNPSVQLDTLQHQFTPDAPLNPFNDPEFSLSLDYSFTLPLYQQIQTDVPSVTTQLFNENYGFDLHHQI